MSKLSYDTIGKNHLKPSKKFFDTCKSMFPIYIWRNKTKEIVSSQRKIEKTTDVIQKRLTKVTNLNFHSRTYYFKTVVVSKKRLEIQTYIITQIVKDGKEQFITKLLNLELYFEGNRYPVTKNGEVWVKGKTATNFAYNLMYLPMNWQKRCKSNEDMKYLDLTITGEIDIDIIPHLYKYRNRIEYCQKIGAISLANQLIGSYNTWTYTYYGYRSQHIKPDMRKVTMRWLKNHKSFFKNSDRVLETLELKLAIESRGFKYISGIEKYITKRDLELLPDTVKLVKFQNWVIKGSVRIDEYRDYLRMLNDIGVNLNDKLLYPKNFQKAHDDAVKAYNEFKREEKFKKEERKEKSYLARLDDLIKLDMEIDQFLFIVPKSLKEIIQEGYDQHHCVASYTQAVSKGETTIIFVRQKNEPDKPLYTMELRKGKIVQLRGAYNKDAPESANNAAKKYVETLLKERIAV
ncbi:PcfJ family protein [Streptococcus suis]|nr:PcfJ family protein [Streptococcus suis]